MPPRKSPAGAASTATNGVSHVSSPGQDQDEASPPFFNTTFSTHRVSPLYLGPQGLAAARLEHLARRLRDTLVGDVVRGIQIGLESIDTPIGQVGPLRKVRIRPFRLQSILDEAPSPEGTEGSEFLDGSATGIWIDIRHENAAYVALLLPRPTDVPRDNHLGGLSSVTPFANANGADDTELDPARFMHLPLLLLRMPQALKAVICDWLSTTFDCRVSKIMLGTKTLISVWESWISAAGIPSKGPDFILTITFNAPVPCRSFAVPDAGPNLDEVDEPGLRSLEITIASSDLGRFLHAGQAEGVFQGAVATTWANDARERRRLAGGHTDDGWAWRDGQEPPNHPFTEALARYLDHHLALNLFHPSVRVVQISCGAFVLAQSRLKLIRPGNATHDGAQAAWVFLKQLGARM